MVRTRALIVLRCALHRKEQRKVLIQSQSSWCAVVISLSKQGSGLQHSRPCNTRLLRSSMVDCAVFPRR